MTPALEIEHLSYSYSAQNRQKKNKTGALNFALNDISLTVERGEIFGLLGPNGSGKTTLFKILSTTLASNSGSIKIFGKEISLNSLRARRHLGLVFQSPSLDKKLTVKENLIHQGHLYGLSGEILRERIEELLLRAGLKERETHLVETLSGGLQRRVEIAKGLIHSPQIFLMDEPSTGLDPGARIDLWRTIFELKEMEKTVLLTTHLMEEAEKCDRLAILNCGAVVALGTPQELKEEIGGDVITMETKNPEALSIKIREKYSLSPLVLENAVRLEKDRGHELVPELIKDFSEEILSVTVSKPTLEDVFIRRTGHKFWHQDSEESAYGSRLFS